MKNIITILMFCINFLFAQDNNNIDNKLELEILINSNNCQINSFTIDNEVFIGVGSIFNDETLENKACLIKYDILNKKLIQEKDFSNIDSFYKIISFNNKYFLLGAKLLREEQNIGRSYSDKGFNGLLMKLDKDNNIEKEVEINLNGFGNVKDFQINDNKIIVLTSTKNATIYDEEITANLSLKIFDINLILLKKLYLKTYDCLADDLFIDKDKYIVMDKYNKKICIFDENGHIVKYLYSKSNNKILEIEILKNRYKEKLEIVAFDSNYKYALKQTINFSEELNKYENYMYIYKIGE